MDRAWWIRIAGVVAFAVLMSLTLGWLDRARRKRTTDDSSLPYPTGSKIAMLLFVPLFPVLNIVVLVRGLIGADGDNSLLDIGLAIACLPMSWLFIFGALDSWITKFRILSNGLSYRSSLGRTGTIGWKDVSQVRLTKWHMFRIRTRDRQVVRISTSRRGLYLLAAAILAQAPREDIDAPTLKALEQTAAGSPPPLS